MGINRDGQYSLDTKGAKSFVNNRFASSAFHTKEENIEAMVLSQKMDSGGSIESQLEEVKAMTMNKQLEFDINNRLDHLSQDLRDLTDNNDQELDAKVQAALKQLEEAKNYLLQKSADLANEKPADPIEVLLMKKLEEVSEKMEDIKECMSCRLVDLTEEIQKDEEIIQEEVLEKGIFPKSHKKQKHERYSEQIGKIEGMARTLEMHKEELKNTTFSHLGDVQN